MTSLVGCPRMDVISTPQSEQCAFFAKRKKSFFLKFIIKLTLCGRLKSQTSISNIGWVNSQGCHFLAFLIWLMPFFQLDKNWKTFSDFIYCGWTRFFVDPPSHPCLEAWFQRLYPFEYASLLVPVLKLESGNLLTFFYLLCYFQEPYFFIGLA